MPFSFDTGPHTYARLPATCFVRVAPARASAPALRLFNVPLARALGVDVEQLTAPGGVNYLVGNAVVAPPLAQAYAGHQFGHFVPQLGDGRAMLLGEVRTTDGQLFDLQLKGAGPTPFSRRGDGRAALGPVLREYIVSEAMHALGIATTRALSAATTGDAVFRDAMLPGAVLVRVARSHVRVGTFEYFAHRNDKEALKALVDYALARHYPEAPIGEWPAHVLLDHVIAAQAKLVASWLGVGFVHGVMNTDNMAIGGDTLDYGPCAFLDGYDPQHHFSSIDRQGRYAYAAQPHMALFNLTRLAEALLPLLAADEDAAVTVAERALSAFFPQFAKAYDEVFARKLGFVASSPEVVAVREQLLTVLAETRGDFTATFAALGIAPHAMFVTPPLAAFHAAWCTAVKQTGSDDEITRRLATANPRIIPRNHVIEAVIEQAMAGDFQPAERLHAALAQPFVVDEATAAWLSPPGEAQWDYRTFCGT